MDKGKIAEWVLSLAMDPLQAAAVSGDLLEADASHDGFRFWSNVIQTLVAVAWRDAKARPLFVVGLAVRGALVQSAIAYSIALPVVAVTISHQHLAREHPLWFIPLGLVNVLLAPFFAGRWVAQRSLGKDLAICVAMAMVAPFVIAGTGVPFIWAVSLMGNHGHPRFPRLWMHWWEIGFLLPYLAGALLLHRRRQIAAV